MTVLWIFLGSIVAGLLMLFLMRGPLKSERLSRTNFRGVKLPTAAGVVFAPAFLLVWLVVVDHAVRHFSVEGRLLTSQFHALRLGFDTMLILVLGFCLLGLFDDVAGDTKARGFKGHFSAALRGDITTGLVKAILGLLVALVALHPVLATRASFGFKDYGILVLNAAVVALTANFFNLLDRRPGRALKVFFPVLALCAGLTLRYGVLPLVPYQPLYLYVAPALSVAAVALVLFYGDLREKFMLGDAGSNVLGAVIGLGLVFGTSFWWRAGVLVILLVLNAVSEKFSFTDIISSNRALSWIDSLGTKVRQADGDNNN